LYTTCFWNDLHLVHQSQKIGKPNNVHKYWELKTKEPNKDSQIRPRSAMIEREELYYNILENKLWSRNCLPFRSTWVYPGFQWGSCYSIFSFIWYVCRSFFVLLYLFFWALCCLSFDLRILITLQTILTKFIEIFNILNLIDML
jgi:hypothetical protein